MRHKSWVTKRGGGSLTIFWFRRALGIDQQNVPKPVTLRGALCNAIKGGRPHFGPSFVSAEQIDYFQSRAQGYACFRGPFAILTSTFRRRQACLGFPKRPLAKKLCVQRAWPTWTNLDGRAKKGEPGLARHENPSRGGAWKRAAQWGARFFSGLRANQEILGPAGTFSRCLGGLN